MNEELKDVILKMAEARQEVVRTKHDLDWATIALNGLMGKQVENIYAKAANPDDPFELPGTRSTEREHLLLINSLLDGLRFDDETLLGKTQKVYLDADLAHQQALAELKQQQYTYRALLNPIEYEGMD